MSARGIEGDGDHEALLVHSETAMKLELTPPIGRVHSPLRN
jgi:hypothetical protein